MIIMRYKQTTQTPNELFDIYLPKLTGSEYKLLSIIIRQTYGWRKKRDRMNLFQLRTKTGLSKRVISKAIQSLIDKKLIEVTDYSMKNLHSALNRKGKTSIFFAPIFKSEEQITPSSAEKVHEVMQNTNHNNTNIITKRTFQNNNPEISKSDKSMEERLKVMRMRYENERRRNLARDNLYERRDW